MTEASVTTDVDDGVATLTLANPDLRNALSAEMGTALSEAVAGLPEDLRCVVLGADGSTFCAGGDIQAMVEGVRNDAPTEERFDSLVPAVTGAVEDVYDIAVPTVAAVDGPAFGAGAALALACDLQLGSEAAKFSFGFRQVGLSIDSGTSALLSRQVGENVAMELVYTGELIEADEAVELGLLNRVSPVDRFEADLEALVDRIASGPTVALSHSKRLLRRGRNRSLAEAMDAEEAAIRAVLETADHAEGTRAFVEQRDPEFEGR
jgi:2-(1,2-epoxy-1,2-dihydrophenyl)acetyl-CoA isomerase